MMPNCNGIKIIFGCLWWLVLAVNCAAKVTNEIRVIILVDESHFLNEGWVNDRPKIEAVNSAVISLMRKAYSDDKNVEFSLRSFGSQYILSDSNCLDFRKEVAFSKDNLTQMYLRLKDLHPKGEKSLAYALSELKADLTELDRYSYFLVIFTDNSRSCGQDPCENEKKIEPLLSFRPVVFSFCSDSSLKENNDCLGRLFTVQNQHDIDLALDSCVEMIRPTRSIHKQSTPGTANCAIKFVFGDRSEQIEGYTANVSKRGDNIGKVYTQLCSDVSTYDSGIYYVEVNSAPPFCLNVTLKGGEETIITVPKPGEGQFLNYGKIKSISLYRLTNDRYAHFLTLSQEQLVKQNTFNFLPGTYYTKIIYSTGQVTSIPFEIESDKKVQVKL